MMRKWMVASMAAAVMVLLVPALVLANGVKIYGELQYSGSHTESVVVCALKEGEESPSDCRVIDAPVAYPVEFGVGPLDPGKYYVCALIDLEGDKSGPPNPDEPQGCSALVDATQGSVDGVIIVMQDPPAPQVEFVPEPGTLVLLGSGLAGLAGYVTLRWRNRK